MKKYLICGLIFIGLLSGISSLKSSQIIAGSATILYPIGGGTGTSTAPTYGKVLVGNSGGTYTLTATSSLGISGGSGTPAGSDTYIQYNNAGSFGASSLLSYAANSITNRLDVGDRATTSIELSTSGNVGFENVDIFGSNSDGSAYFEIHAATSSGTNSSLDLFDDKGQILLSPGKNSYIQTTGTFKLKTEASTQSAVLDTTSISSSDKTFTFPNTTGTFCLTTTCVGGQGEPGQFGFYTNSGTSLAGSFFGYASSTNQDVLLGTNAGGQNSTTSATVAGLTAIGYRALYLNTTGTNNLAVGSQALTSNTTGSNNTAFGALASTGMSGGNDNVLIGQNTGIHLTTGSQNILIGRNITNMGGNYPTTGSNNILIGYNVVATSSTATNFLNIGNTIFGTLTATSSGSTIPAFTGRVGVGSTTPFATFSISGTSGTDPLMIATSTPATNVFGIDQDGHRWSGGPAPVISSCGTGTGTVVGDDQSGTVTTATAATACTVTFSKAYAATPTCTVVDNSLVGFADVSSISTTAVTFGISSALTGGNLFYSCQYHHN